MNHALLLLACCIAICGPLELRAQVKTSSPPRPPHAMTTTEREVRDALTAYAQHSVAADRDAVAGSYDRRGYVSVGNGYKRLVDFEESKRRYETTWISPQAFDWRDVSVEVLSPEAAVVTALFDVRKGGVTRTYSFTGLFVKQAGKWVMRVKDESLPQDEYAISRVAGDRSTAGPFSEIMTAHAGASIGAHRHTADLRIRVIKGREFILMGDLETAHVQVFDAGSSFVIPAGVWHVEWFESESEFELSGVGPLLTERPPATVRKP